MYVSILIICDSELSGWVGGWVLARSFSKPLYNSKEWQAVREFVLMRDRYLCTRCGRAAIDVHHVIYLTPDNIGDTSISLNPDNLISLCKDCHEREHHSKQDAGDGYYFDADGMIQRIPPIKK